MILDKSTTKEEIKKITKTKGTKEKGTQRGSVVQEQPKCMTKHSYKDS